MSFFLVKSALPAKSFRSQLLRITSTCVFSALVVVAATAQSSGGASFGTNAVVTKAVENQLRAKTGNYMFHVRKETPKWTETRVYVNTTEGIANLLVAVNERPVDDEQLAREAVRLQKLLRDPQALHKKQANEKEASRRETEIVRALPHAFMYEYEGTESGKSGQDIVRLRFRPDPQFHPTSREVQVLTGLEGTMFIDVQREMIVRIEGTLFRGVNFGWGLVGHLDKGGRVLAEQTDVGDGNWRITRLGLDLTGHALLFKHISVQFTETFSQFEQVTGTLTFADGVKLLKNRVNAGPQGKPQNSTRPGAP